MKIQNIHAEEILASGGYPTIETTVTLEDGTIGVAAVPYGASSGSHEATVLVDGDSSRWNGQGMQHAVTNVETRIKPALLGQDAYNQRHIDQIMIDLDGTENKANLGGNAILSVSLAVAEASAASQKLELYKYLITTFNTGVDLTKLPRPMAVVIEGGKHADQTTDFQEYCLSATGAASVEESVRMVLEIYHQLSKVLKENHLSTNVGNEGAFAPNGIAANVTPLDLMQVAISRTSYQLGKDLGFSLDLAASEFFQDGKYHLKLENRELSSSDLIEYLKPWLAKYPIISLEDPLHEDDWAGWAQLKPITDASKTLLIGDDLTVTSPVRLQTAIDQKAISAILIKLNQIGTVTETIDCCMLAKHHGIETITSHRGGGETGDTYLVDLAVAVGSRFIKVGPTRGERVAKYNRLIKIERQLCTPTN